MADSENDQRMLGSLASTVRAHRARRGLTRQALAGLSGLSPRFLARIESGHGNISLLRFCDLARALGVTPADLLREASRPPGPFIALLGLRGAGKSTIGAALAARLGIPFRELDSLIEEELGMPLSQVFELHGESYCRRMERDILERFLDTTPAAVIATGGGIVTWPQSLSVLGRSCLTVWLRASAEDHWQRVVSQGDRRPMAGNPNAMNELRDLLAEREPLYRGSDLTIDTSAVGVEEAVQLISRRVSHA